MHSFHIIFCTQLIFHRSDWDVLICSKIMKIIHLNFSIFTILIFMYFRGLNLEFARLFPLLNSVLYVIGKWDGKRKSKSFWQSFRKSQKGVIRQISKGIWQKKIKMKTNPASCFFISVVIAAFCRWRCWLCGQWSYHEWRGANSTDDDGEGKHDLHRGSTGAGMLSCIPAKLPFHMLCYFDFWKYIFVVFIQTFILNELQEGLQITGIAVCKSDCIIKILPHKVSIMLVFLMVKQGLICTMIIMQF